MRRLPLFPLPVVLFPGAVMPLHIFEGRYRRMMGYCLEFDRRFGLIHHDPDVDGPFLLESGRVGTIAEIREFQPLPDGRSLILVHGNERFEIRDGLESDVPYYEAVVDEYADWTTGQSDLPARRLALAGLFEEVLEHLGNDGVEAPSVDLNEDVSFQLAEVVQIDPRWQQSLIELRRETDRLDRLEALFRLVLDADAADA